jgi:hypothetical protein
VPVLPGLRRRDVLGEPAQGRGPASSAPTSTDGTAPAWRFLYALTGSGSTIPLTIAARTNPATPPRNAQTPAGALAFDRTTCRSTPRRGRDRAAQHRTALPPRSPAATLGGLTIWVSSRYPGAALLGVLQPRSVRPGPFALRPLRVSRPSPPCSAPGPSLTSRLTPTTVSAEGPSSGSASFGSMLARASGRVLRGREADTSRG